MTVAPLSVRGRPRIGAGLEPYVIAEIGTNHNRDIETAKALVRMVAEAGCHCAKFQIYEPDEIVCGSIRARDYGLDGLYGDISAQEMFARHLQTPKAWMPELKELCHSLGLDFGATIHGWNGLAWAREIELDLVKIASMDHTNLPFLAALVNQVEAPILISFGMAGLEDIDAALSVLKPHKPGVGAFHCIAVYPPEPAEMRLRTIPFLTDRSGVSIGFSDHTTDVTTAVAALALGAVMFEKHVTLDRTQNGPDHPFALEPEMVRDYVANLKSAALALGQPGFTPPSPRETVNRSNYVKSIIARSGLPAGHALTADDLYLARPGTGIEPRHLAAVLGRTLVRPVAAETPLSWEDLGGR